MIIMGPLKDKNVQGTKNVIDKVLRITKSFLSGVSAVCGSCIKNHSKDLHLFGVLKENITRDDIKGLQRQLNSAFYKKPVLTIDYFNGTERTAAIVFNDFYRNNYNISSADELKRVLSNCSILPMYLELTDDSSMRSMSNVDFYPETDTFFINIENVDARAQKAVDNILGYFRRDPLNIAGPSSVYKNKVGQTEILVPVKVLPAENPAETEICGTLELLSQIDNLEQDLKSGFQISIAATDIRPEYCGFLVKITIKN